MWGRVYPLVILFLVANIFKASCEATSSLTFVIDDTLSMTDDIDQVKTSVDRIMDIVFNEKSSLINNMVLVTFNDPEAHVREVTTNRNTFKTALSDVYVHNYDNWDCEEMAMKGLLKALENSRSGSYIYVFTDASAKDYRQSEEVKEMCQRKQSQIVFVLTGHCNGLNWPDFQVYYDIAAACSGHAFFVHKDEVNQVLQTIEETIKGNKTVMTSKIALSIAPNVYTDIPFTIDEYTEYAIVSVSGYMVSLSIKGPASTQTKIMWNNNGKVIKISDQTPGEYVATVMGHTSTSIIIVGRTDFHFSHGFSELQPKLQSDTSPQPIADANVHLSIAVTDPQHLMDINTAQILQMNESIIKVLPLTEISRDFYVTKPFVAPSQMFKVAVIGNVKATGRSIRRIAKIPVTPQKPPKIEPNKTRPITHIEEGKSIEVEYGSKVKLTCKVTAYPEPNIKWINSKGATMKSSNAVFQYPYEFISYLEISNAIEKDNYMCYVVNSEGIATQTINVTVKDALIARSVPPGTTKVVYGSEGTIECDIKSKMPMHIRWYYAKNTGIYGQIVTSDKYVISTNGTKLKIIKMDLDLAGKYSCKASLINNEDVQSTYSTRVEVDGLKKPQLTGETIKKVMKGKTATIQCKIIQGVPKPTITWQYVDKAGIKLASTDNVLSISNVEDEHAGRYKCVAENKMGGDEHITTLIIQDPPKITSNSSYVFQSTEGIDTLLSIPCVATGLPKPVIIWKLEGLAISPNAKYSTEDGKLLIKEPKVGDTNNYTCEAKNEVGLDSMTFQASIFQAPKLLDDAAKTVLVNETAKIKCMVVKGEPKPKITWQFMNNSALNFETITGSDNVLQVTSVKEHHAGRYKCVAENKVGKAEHITTLNVEFSPRIITKPSTVYEGIEGDVALRISCDVVGNPRPIITWKIDGVSIVANSKYNTEYGALIIKKPNTSDTNYYTCEAKNSIGSVSAIFQAKIEKSLNSLGLSHMVYILKDETKKLECAEFNNSESQSVRWIIGGVDVDVNKSYLYVENASVSDDGNYTCRVSDEHGYTHTHTYVVDVGYPPKLYHQTPLDDWRGDISDIFANCQSISKPPADIDWKYNGKELTGQYLTEKGNAIGWGHYTCNVSNVHGSVQRSFDVKSTACFIKRNLEDEQQMPLILTNELTWPTWEFTQQYLIVENAEKITLYCTKYKEVPNSFKKFPKLNALEAICNKEDEFLVDGKNYKLSDLHCNNDIHPSIVKRKVKCSTETSELIRVGYDVSGFLETYEVCFDHAKNIPLYTRMLMTNTDGIPSSTQNWMKYPGIGDEKRNTELTCNSTLPSCCYSKSQLVDARDFHSSSEKNSTFIDYLNAVPYWRPCKIGQTTWEDIGTMVRSQLINYNQFVVWSGTHTLQDRNGTVIPRFLWKVVRFDEDQSIAIVHVNDPSPTDKDIKCENICTEDMETWFTASDKYTYCCKLSDFLKAFNMQGTDVGESLEAVIRKVGKRT